MATKIPKPKKTVEEHQSDVPENELAVLNPDMEIELSGKKYTVREYGHVEFIKLLFRGEPLITHMADMIEARKHIGLFDAVLMVFSKHYDLMLPLILQAASMTQAEFEALDETEFDLLMGAWWGVNHRFFIQKAGVRLAVMAREKQAIQQGEAGVKSTQP